MKSIIASILLTVSLASTAYADTPDWSSWNDLAGKWEAEGSGVPGHGKGSFSFRLDLQSHVMIRKAHTHYPAAFGKPAFNHDDLLVVYFDGAQARANYFDSEGHAINYSANASADGSSWIFLSDPNPNAPQYRLTYSKTDSNSLHVNFEIAPPGQPGNFTSHVEGDARRR